DSEEEKIRYGLNVFHPEIAMIFLLACIMSKTDLSVQNGTDSGYHASIQQHFLAMELIGPSVTAQFSPNSTRAAIGGEIGLGVLWEGFCSEGGTICDALGPSFRYSVVGVQALEYQQEDGRHYFGFASPYGQFHIPFGCKPFEPERNIQLKSPDHCVSAFGSVEYQNRLMAPNQVFWGLGMSYARLFY
ncbi:MAG: hypothetical protein VX278_01820, partial [Myxococcota bacterium]|nr:hypothetical protein [Myxococcota bacterium]